MEWKKHAVNFVVDFEWFSETCKYDFAQNSWGYGTKCDRIGERIDRERAMQYKMEHLEHIFELVNKDCFTDNQKIAITSYIYNTWGYQKLNNVTSFREYVQRCDTWSILYGMRNWGWTANWQVLWWLVKRRTIEIEKFNQ